MNFRVENLGILFGLFALAVPIILHLLQRHRYDILDWGAMQFLPDRVAASRRRWIDEILLMLLRMAMIALIVIALATPISTSAWLAPLSDHSAREVVLVIDGSYSMDMRVPNQLTPWEDAVRWSRDYLEQAPHGERTTVIIARQPPLIWTENAASNLAGTTPRGNPDMPGALALAWRHLQRSKAATKEIIVLTDQQLHGWADPATLAALENLGNQWHSDVDQARIDGLAIPSILVVKVGADPPPSLPNYALAPLTASRGVVKLGQKATFTSALRLASFTAYLPPRSVRVLIDGRAIRELSSPEKVDLHEGQIPLSFQHRFDEEGQHVVSLIVEADAKYDVLGADNEQHAIIEVVKELPILLVDGDRELSAESSSFFLQRALATKHVVPCSALKADMLDAVKPAMIVLADVPRLEIAQVDVIDRFLAGGGGVLIVAGERVARAKAFYNDQLYREGQGWLPAKLGAIGVSTEGVLPEPRKFQHPALELFRSYPDGAMNQVRFSSWWKVALGPKDRASVMGTLANGDPFLLEKPYKQGRVALCTVPLDRRWDSTFPSAWEFPILANELAYYLAGGRASASTLQQGAPIRLADFGTPTQRLSLRTPEVAVQVFDVNNWPWIFENTGAVGLYQVKARNGHTWSFVVPPDLRESNLTRCSDDDWRKVRDRLPIVWHTESPQTPAIDPSEARREELWWLLLLAVLGLLCSEVWLTRRMVLARGR